ncbi:DUF4083 family protein [Solibacillus ferritrahens]|uniref:DUF4083 family protein n=1 Tax=Solibacillus ferritrahens TaxID=3098620 RepID=UPI003009A4A9
MKKVVLTLQENQISFALFIRRLLINSAVKANNSNDLGEKMDKLIEQNEQLLLLLKEQK